jgi:hypothetical protein
MLPAEEAKEAKIEVIPFAQRGPVSSKVTKILILWQHIRSADTALSSPPDDIKHVHAMHKVQQEARGCNSTAATFSEEQTQHFSIF